MVRPLRLGGDCHGDTDDAEEHEHQRPPRVVGKSRIGRLGRGYDGADEGDDPGKLHGVSTQPHAGAAVLTMAMEMVASAKGSPMMRPTLKVVLWP
jgi:hypothetical protein